MSSESRGYVALRDPQQNLDMSFDEMQRERLGLTGLLPPREQPMAIQAMRALKHLSLLPTPLDKYMYLMALQVPHPLPISGQLERREKGAMPTGTAIMGSFKSCTRECF